MRVFARLLPIILLAPGASFAQEPPFRQSLIAKPSAFQTLVNPECSHCVDESKRRAKDLRPDDRILAWTRGYSDGGAIPMRFFLDTYRVISDSYGVFVNDPDAGFARGFAPSYEFRFHGWKNGVMVMRHKDGTLYSCLSGLAFDGPKKGARLTPVPTLVSDWGYWLEKYPGAVAYHMFDKYQASELTPQENADAVRSRGKVDPRLKESDIILGVWTGKSAHAYPLKALEKAGIVKELVGPVNLGETLVLSEPLVVLWEPRTRSAAAYRPIASPPRKYKGPQPDKAGISPPDEGILLAAEGSKPRALTLALSGGRITDAETKSLWDVAGRCFEGELKGWTLDWIDSVQVKWLAWSAEYPQTEIYADEKKAEAPIDVKKAVKEIAGTAEFLRLLPKPFATVKAIDTKNHAVTLLIDGEMAEKIWPLEPDAEIKVSGWWGRLEQFQPGDRAWAWLKLDRKKNPVSVVMLADELSEYDFHGRLREKKDKARIAPDEIEAKRETQKAWLARRWAEQGLPGTVTFLHVFSGELELSLDHEAMSWGRSLEQGAIVHLAAEPPIKGVVKMVTPWRERTVVRLVVGELESSELKVGQRLGLKMSAPVLVDNYPPDLGRPRAKTERVEWFLASTYCTCSVAGDICTGHFYTLASCNPNGCGMPNAMRTKLGKKIDDGMTDRQIMDELVKDQGQMVLRPHLRP